MANNGQQWHLMSSRGRNYSSNVWSPTDIGSKLICWLDASHTDSIVKNTSDKVSQWSDRSGQGNHATQSASAQQPNHLVSDPMMNGLASVGDAQDSGAIGLDTPSFSASTIYIITYYKDGVDSSFDGHATMISGPGSYGADRIQGGGSSFVNSSSFNSAGSYKNGDATDMINSALPMPATLWKFKSSSSVTQDFSIGYNSQYTDRDWQGAFAEIIFTDGTETSIEAQKIEGYLAWKWELESSFVKTHPYAGSAP